MCLRTVAGVSRSMPPVSVEFHGYHKTVRKLMCVRPPNVLRILPYFKQNGPESDIT